jgi:hypothetical protein
LKRTQVLKYETGHQATPEPGAQGYTFGDIAYWAWTYIRVSAVTALRSDPGVLMREARRLEKATTPFGRALEERGDVVPGKETRR